MGRVAAKRGDRVTGQDTHVVMVPSPTGPVATPTSLPFDGVIADGCCPSVLIEGREAATVGSTVTNTVPHIPPAPPGGVFQTPPTNSGTVIGGSGTVLIGGRPAARHDDTVNTCSDPTPAPNGRIVAMGQVLIG